MELMSGTAEREKMRMKSEVTFEALQMSEIFCECLQILFALSHQLQYFVQSVFNVFLTQGYVIQYG